MNFRIMISVVSLLSSAVMAGDFYGGLGVGQIDAKGMCQPSDAINTYYAAAGVDDGGGCDSSVNQLKLNAGFQFNEFVSVDLTYLPKTEISGTANGYDDGGEYIWDVDTEMTSEFSSWSLVAVGHFPLSETLSLVGKGGFQSWKNDSEYVARVDWSYLGNREISYFNESASEKGRTLTYGLGLHWKVWDTTLLKVEWETITDVEHFEMDSEFEFHKSETDVNVLSVGMNFFF